MEMTAERSFSALLHRVTHRFPGVPAHAERPAGHRSRACQGAELRRPQSSLSHRWNHSPARPPRVLAAWQNRIAAFLGQEMR
jgi:hypothetical protein